MTKMVRAILNSQFEIILPEHRAARPEWYREEGWEKARLLSMYQTTKKGDLVFYVGAEEGEMCALLKMWGAEVVMFEPNPRVWPNIKAIWDANKLEVPVMTFAGFAANRNIPEDVISLAYANSFPDCANGPVIGDHGFKNLHEADGTVPMMKIDLLDELFEKPVDMISLDVEGAEWEVLRGAEQTLRKHHPRIYLSLHPEFMYEIYGEYANDLRKWIKDLGYKETLLAYDHEVHLMYEVAK